MKKIAVAVAVAVVLFTGANKVERHGDYHTKNQLAGDYHTKNFLAGDYHTKNQLAGDYHGAVARGCFTIIAREYKTA